MEKIINIKTADKIIKHKYRSVRVFTVDYSKKISKNEFHIPRAARIIVETDQSIFQYILKMPIIHSDEKFNINIYISDSSKLIKQEEKYFTNEELYLAKKMRKVLKAKKTISTTIDETIEYQRASTIIEINKLISKKLFHDKGGGF